MDIGTVPGSVLLRNPREGDQLSGSGAATNDPFIHEERQRTTSASSLPTARNPSCQLSSAAPGDRVKTRVIDRRSRFAASSVSVTSERGSRFTLSLVAHSARR